MAQTVIRGTQILNNTVQRQDLDVSTVGQAVVTKLVQGSGITLSSTGADAGTGDVTVTSPDVVSTDAGNIATLGTDSHILVPQSQIWSVRLRSYNALQNSAFEVDQANTGSLLVAPASGTRIADRWFVGRAGSLTGTVNTQGAIAGFGAGIVVPGSSYVISRTALNHTVGTAQASLAAADYYYFYQYIEGPRMRALSQDSHSLQLLVNSTVAGLKFSVSLRDNPATQSWVSLCTIPSANTWTLITLPGIAVWPSGNWSALPGAVGYQLGICLACGTTLTTSTLNAWQGGAFIAASGMSNFLTTSGAIFRIASCQHQPGAACETLIDCPFPQAYDEALRYFQKSYEYGVSPGTVTNAGGLYFSTPSAATVCVGPLKFHKPLAKIPTMTFYNAATGAANSVRDAAGTDHGSAAAGAALGSAGLGSITFATATAGASYINFHYTADTGW